MNNHIMIDLETFGTGELPMITSIGYAVFDENNIRGSGVIHPELIGNIDADTVMWWLKQDTEAQLKITNAERKSNLAHCLIELGGFIMDSNIQGVWANGVSFDLRILKEWYTELAMDVPWKYYQERCLRSFKEFGLHRIKPDISHCAKADAIAQAKTVQNVWRTHQSVSNIKAGINDPDLDPAGYNPDLEDSV